MCNNLKIFKLFDLTEYSVKLSENIKTLIKINNLNTLELSNKLNISYSVIHKLINGNNNPTMETLIKISSFFNINIGQLLGEQPLVKNLDQKQSSLKFIPIVDLEAVASYIAQKTTSNIYDHNLWIASNIFFSNDCFAFYSDATMEPTFKNKSIIIIEKVENSLEKYINKFVMILINETQVYIKKLLSDGYKIYLEPLNINLPVLEMCDKDKIIGYIAEIRINTP